MDVNGAFSLREGPALLLTNNNENIDLGTTIYSIYRITGPTDNFNILSFDTPEGVSANDGQILTLINSTSFIMTLVHDDGSAGNPQRRIYCPNEANLVLEGQNAAVTLQYNMFLERWVVNGSTDVGGYGKNVKSKTGSTDIDTDSSDAVDMTDMDITFTPKHSTVFVNFSASGTMDKGGGSDAKAFANFELNKDGTTIAGATTLASDRSLTESENGGGSTSCEVIVYDSGGATNDYTDNETYIRTYTPPVGQKVSITFLSFRTEGYFDGLRIYNGPNTSYPLFASTSTSTNIDMTCLPGAWNGNGEYSPVGRTFTSTAPGGQIHLVFTSDYSVHYSGWEACINYEVPAPIDCREIFYDTGGANGNYNNGENSGPITYSPTNPGEKVVIEFLSFNTEQSYDGLMVYDGPNISSPIISSGSTYNRGTCPNGAWTGTGLYSAAGKVFTSSAPGGELTFWFTSDSSVNNTGWEACVNSVSVYSLDTAWNASFTMYPVTVTPGVETTIKIRWSRDSSGGNADVLRNNVASDLDRSHRSLTIFD